MRWDRFFDDLEDQLASEWEAERAALDTEAERLRLSRVTLRERLGMLVERRSSGPSPSFELAGGEVIAGEVTGVGADWVALAATDRRVAATLVPLWSVQGVSLPQEEVLRTARPAPLPSLSERMTFGFVLRDVVRRRAAVRIHLTGGGMLAGTIDRAGADHLDLALHEPGSPRRAEAVTGYRVIPFPAVSWVRLDAEHLAW